MHNLGTVIIFEFTRTIKKKSFWLSILAIPALIGVVITLLYISSRSADTATAKANQAKFSLVILDDSHLIFKPALVAIGAKTVTSDQQGIDMVKQGKIDAFFHYPADLIHNPIKITAKDVGLVDNGKYDATATGLLSSVVSQKIGSPQDIAVIKGNIATDVTTYQDGQITPGIERVIAPGAFLALFYIVVLLLANRMLSSTTEEKENRVIEMILTTVSARTLILGKILAMVLVGIVQVVVTSLPPIIAFVFFRDKLNLPNIDLSHLVIDPTQMAIGAVTFALAFLLLTGCLVAIGAAVPTAKEANNFFGAVMLMLFVPFYAISAIVSDPQQIIVRVFTYFPLTSPVTLMVRNAVGNLAWYETTISLAILAVSCVLAIAIAARTFGYGTLEYSRKLSLREIFTVKS